MKQSFQVALFLISADRLASALRRLFDFFYWTLGESNPELFPVVRYIYPSFRCLFESNSMKKSTGVAAPTTDLTYSAKNFIIVVIIFKQTQRLIFIGSYLFQILRCTETLIFKFINKCVSCRNSVNLYGLKQSMNASSFLLLG